MEPTQLALILFVTGFVACLFEITNNRVFPYSLWPLAKLLNPPRFGLQPVVEFLGLDFVFGLSRSSYSLPVGRDEVDPPDRSAFANCHLDFSSDTRSACRF